MTPETNPSPRSPFGVKAPGQSWWPQFGIKTLLTVTAALAVLLGVLQWMEASPWAMAVVLGVVLLSAVAAVGLVLALAASLDQRDDGDQPH